MEGKKENENENERMDHRLDAPSTPKRRGNFLILPLNPLIISFHSYFFFFKYRLDRDRSGWIEFKVEKNSIRTLTLGDGDGIQGECRSVLKQ